MYSTTTLVKNSRFSGKIVGTHQQLDQAARKILARYIPRGKYFPSSKEILHFEGTRGPDGLKRKSPGVDEPSHMLTPEVTPASDPRTVPEIIVDHRWNLVRALKEDDRVRAAFEAAWMAHMITDGLTPAHHFPLSNVKNELMTDKELVKVFGAPIKGMMHGRNMLETLRNNWLYWGAGGHMSKHIAYEYGVVMLAAALPQRALTPRMGRSEFSHVDVMTAFNDSLERIQKFKMYDRFCTDGWTTELAYDTKDFLLPEIVRAIALGWFSALEEAYNLNTTQDSAPKRKLSKTSKKPAQKAKKPTKEVKNAHKV